MTALLSRLAAAALTVAAFTVAPAFAADGPPFTAAQAAHGSQLYSADCASCHGAHLEGVMGPSLLRGKIPDPGSVKDIYAFLSQSMPLNAPGSLSPADYAAIMAFLLKQNGHVPGTTALTPAIAKSSTAAY